MDCELGSGVPERRDSSVPLGSVQTVWCGDVFSNDERTGETGRCVQGPSKRGSRLLNFLVSAQTCSSKDRAEVTPLPVDCPAPRFCECNWPFSTRQELVVEGGLCWSIVSQFRFSFACDICEPRRANSVRAAHECNDRTEANKQQKQDRERQEKNPFCPAERCRFGLRCRWPELLSSSLL
jgi:hypothetical protein